MAILLYTSWRREDAVRRWDGEAAMISVKSGCNGMSISAGSDARFSLGDILIRPSRTCCAERCATSHEIMAITGHRTLEEVERYTKAVRQAKLATICWDSAPQGLESLFTP